MATTTAERLIARGREEGATDALKDVLGNLLVKRFQRIPKAVAETIAETDDRNRLDDWIDRAITARSIVDVGIN